MYFNKYYSILMYNFNKNIFAQDCIFIKLTLSFFLSFNLEVIYIHKYNYLSFCFL